MKSSRSRQGFTLIELIAVIAILACLVSLIIPTASRTLQRINAVACLSNLRQIGATGLLYAGDHDQCLPMIEPWPSQPVYSATDGAVTLLQALGPYGITDKTLQCRSDVNGPNYYAKEGSSYQWCPMASGQKLQAVRLPGFGGGNGITLSGLLEAFDYSNIHNDASNIVFGDGHVAAASN